MSTLTTDADGRIGHPDLAPRRLTAEGALWRIALGRWLLAEPVGGWLVQSATSVVVGTPGGRSLADVAVALATSSERLEEIRALRPAHQPRDLVWSLDPTPAMTGWEPAGPPATLVRFEAGASTPGQERTAATRTTRVRDASQHRRLCHLLATRTAGTAPDTEALDPRLLVDERLRAWIVEAGPVTGALLAATVDGLDVVVAVGGSTDALRPLLEAWRQDRPGLAGAALLLAPTPWRGGPGVPVHAAVHHRG